MAMNGKHNFTELAKAMTFCACSSKKIKLLFHFSISQLYNYAIKYLFASYN